MKISRVLVRNFRSIKQADISLADFSIFVGQNNHGKTNLFESIEWFYNAKSSTEDLFFDKNTSEPIEVELIYTDVSEEDIEKLSTETNKTKIRSLLDGETSFAVKKTSTTHKRTYTVNGVTKPNPSGLDTAINEFLPKLEYVTTKIRLEDVSQYKDKNPIGQMLSGVLTAIVAESEEYREFRSQFQRLFEDDSSEVRVKLNELGDEVCLYLNKQFPEGVDVRFTVNPPQFSDLLKSFDTTVNDGVATKAHAKGDGMQRAIMLAIIQAYADFRRRQLDGSSFLFLIDEAELHLHPSAQRLLKKALEDISQSDQVMLNTHSSVLVVDEADNQKTFKVEKDAKISSVTEISEVEKIDIIYELLGGSPYDLLLPRNFLIVEGKSEYELITRIIKKHYKDDFRGLKILFAGGDIVRQRESIDAVDKTLRPLVGESAIYKDALVVVLDKPNAQQQNTYESFRQGYSYLFDDSRVFELSECSLEEYYPDPWKKTAAEVEALQATKNGKTDLAKRVADEISKEDFEHSLTILFDALKKCNEKAFS
jgi:putative ATP-dependent endonuclease of the OLD family